MSRKVFLVVSTFDGTGPGMVLATLAQGLAAEGWDPVLVATHGVERSQLIDDARASGFPVENLNMRGMWDAGAAARFLSLCRRHRPAVVHTRTIRADLIGRVAAARRVPVLNNLVNLYPQDSVAQHGARTGRALTQLVRLSSGAARLLVANAQAVADNARSVFRAPPERVRVVYDGLDLAPYADAEPADLAAIGVPASARVALTVARLHAQKAIPDLVAATIALPSDVHVLIAGDGPDRPAVEAAIASTEPAVRSRLHLLGLRPDIPNLLAAADLFVLPSHFEGLPSAIIEAMGAGKPVVATAVGGVPELVVEGTGWVVPSGSPGELALAIERALDADLAAVGTAARQRAQSMFSADAMTAAFAALYEEVAA